MTERLPWSDFLAGFDWRQGEHVSLIGPTGVGKTTLAHQLLPMRDHVAILGTKPADPSLSAMLRSKANPDGFRRLHDWTPAPGERRVCVWPRFRRVEDVIKQREVMAQALRSVFVERGWCVYIDEARYLTEQLRLRTTMSTLWTQGRSVGITVVAGAQRPKWVPVEFLTECTHLFMFRDLTAANRREYAKLAGADEREVESTIRDLARFEVLYLDRRTGDMRITKVDE